MTNDPEDASAAGSWPEQEAVWEWWGKHQHELKTAVTAYRIKLQKQLAEAQALVDVLRDEVLEHKTKSREAQAGVERLRAEVWAQNDINNDQRRYNAAQERTKRDLRAKLAAAVEIVTRWHEHQTAPHADCGCVDCAALAKIEVMGSSGSEPVDGEVQAHGDPARDDCQDGVGVDPEQPDDPTLWCDCELRNRSWNPCTGKCETCGRRFRDLREGLRSALSRPARTPQCGMPNHVCGACRGGEEP